MLNNHVQHWSKNAAHFRTIDDLVGLREIVAVSDFAELVFMWLVDQDEELRQPP